MGFDYAHLRPEKLSAIPVNGTRVQICRRCTCEFSTESRVAKYCPGCRPIKHLESNVRSKRRKTVNH